MTTQEASTGPSQLPLVLLLTVGGTIAGTSTSRTDSSDYKIGGMEAAELLAMAPELAQIARIRTVKIANVASSDVRTDTLLRLSKEISHCLKDPEVSGAVVTHGTDTLAESAFFIDVTVSTQKPIVFVGAMRPASALSADGPANLVKAVSLACSKQARGRGTMIALNDRIGSALYINKNHCSAVETFAAHEQGYLGCFVNTVPRFWYSPAVPQHKPYFDIASLEQLPKVAVLHAHPEQDELLIDATIAAGAQGLVIDGAGNGSVSTGTKSKILALEKSGIPVVRTSRTGNGYVSAKPEGIGGGIYPAGKARWLLALALAKQATVEDIRGYFQPQPAI